MMGSNTRFTIVIWIGIFVYMLYQARQAENARMGPRLKGDTNRLLLVAVVLGLSFMGLMYLLPRVATVFPWGFGYISLSAAGAVLLGVVAVFVVGLYFARKSERRPAGRLFVDSLAVLGAAMLVIAVMMTALVLGPRFGIAEPWNVWALAGVFAIVIVVKELIPILRHRRPSSPSR